MSNKNNGDAPAFPVTADAAVYSTGMSLRDWFAGQALAGIGTWVPTPDITARLVDARICAQRAEWAYAQADAMLAARGKSDAS